MNRQPRVVNEVGDPLLLEVSTISCELGLDADAGYR